MVEFTGERVIPGEVDPDLWNEHFARYIFAAGLAANARVLDAGCGSGYGAGELARAAETVVGVDVSDDAVAYASKHYRAAFVRASCTDLPIMSGWADLVVAFEVIEHLADWRGFLAEVRRVLAPKGRFLVSTPNREYYADSRRLTGPNPYHVHEFDVEEFSAELRSRFPHVRMFLQNHVAAIAFQPCDGGGDRIELAGSGGRRGDAREAHFLLALCSAAPLPDVPAHLFLPATANVLRERELHIEQLEAEREQLRSEKHNLVELFRSQNEALEESNRWAAELDEKLRAARERIVEVQEELRATAAAYEAKVAELERANEEKTEWARRLDAELEARGRELARCVELLHEAEQTIEQRTEWAMHLQVEVERLQPEVERLRQVLAMARESRWVKLGRTVGVGPALPQD